MTVQELIAKLKEMPQDYVVEYYTYDDYQDDPVLFVPLNDIEVGKTEEGLPSVQLS
jgi:hypothetical protein